MLVREGDTVLAVDLRGIGETERRQNRQIRWTTGLFGPDYHEFMMAYLLGRSFVGMRTEDALVAARWLSDYGEGVSQPVQLVGIGEAAIPTLHAAALEPTLFERVEIRKMIHSWSHVVQATEQNNQLINTVHGALAVYDLPNLVDLAGADRVRVQQTVDAAGQPLE